MAFVVVGSLKATVGKESGTNEGQMQEEQKQQFHPDSELLRPYRSLSCDVHDGTPVELAAAAAAAVVVAVVLCPLNLTCDSDVWFPCLWLPLCSTLIFM